MRPTIDYQGPLFQWLSTVAMRVGHHNVLILWQFGAVLWLAVLGRLTFTNRFSRLFTALLLLGVGLLRVPGLGMVEQNVDESQWIVSAATLVHDPRFWLSVDGTTSGPLNVCPPALLYYLGLSLDYTTLRLWGLLTCVLPTVGLLLATFRRHLGERVARLAILPVAACLGLVTDSDGVAFNSEQLPMTLLALAGYLMSRIFTGVADKRATGSGWLLGLGLLLGGLPYTKLQVTPIGLVVAVWALAGLYAASTVSRPDRLVRMGWLVAGGLLPTVLVGGYLSATGLTEYAFRAYLLTNLEYAQVGSWGVGAVGLLGRLRLRLPQIFGDMPTTGWFWCVALGLSVAGAGTRLLTGRRIRDFKGERWFTVSVAVVSLYAILQPGNPFAHYQWLGLVPASWLIGSLIGYFRAGYSPATHPVPGGRYGWGRGLVMGGYLLGSLAYPGWLALRHPNPAIGQLVGSQCSITWPVAQAIRQYAKPDETMVIWGWANNLHVETGLVLGSRFIPLYFQVVPGAQQAYFLEVYRQDLLTNRPAVFVDALGSDPHGNYSRYPIRKYPTIQAVLDQNYQLAQVVAGNRIYVLRKASAFPQAL